MFAVVIPTLNNEATLVETLAALVPASAEGIVREVVVADAGSCDMTETIAEAAGCRWIAAEGPRGARLQAGAGAVRRGEWLLFLEPDTVLDPGWYREVSKFVERVERTGRGDRQAACFRAANDELGIKARVAEGISWLRCRILGVGHARQGLLLSRRFYARLGGHDPASPLAEAELMRRIGRRHLSHLPIRAVRRSGPQAETSSGGFRHAVGVMLFFLRLPGALVGRFVDPSSR
ncbi:glycosyltransferase [Breoghania sp. JC706]|uniref:glycosyltransferase n=1 Tax=Breoghania sp. JC706 TaxID=3117732 RepID=UPI00300B906D